MSESVLSIFSRSFIVSGLTFKFLIHFIFVYGVRKCSSFILLQVIDQFSQHHLLKRLSFLHCILLPPLSKIRQTQPLFILFHLQIPAYWLLMIEWYQLSYPVEDEAWTLFHHDQHIHTYTPLLNKVVLYVQLPIHASITMMMQCANYSWLM